MSQAVSMVPALLLDVQPEHRVRPGHTCICCTPGTARTLPQTPCVQAQVLDTCASPGSKTVQIVEMLHQNTALPTGAPPCMLLSRRSLLQARPAGPCRRVCGRERCGRAALQPAHAPHQAHVQPGAGHHQPRCYAVPHHPRQPGAAQAIHICCLAQNCSLQAAPLSAVGALGQGHAL